MKYLWSKKLIKFCHSIRVFFNRFFIILGVLTIGTALLSIYSLFNLVNTMSNIYRGNPSLISVALLILIAIPIVSYALEKGLTSYLQNK